MSLRKKIADSAWFNNTIEGGFAAYIRFAHHTSKWQRIGFEDMDDAVRSGDAIIMALWHQRLMMSPYMFDSTLGPFCSLTSSARAGSMVGRLLGRFGFDTVPMSSHKRHVALSRTVLGKIRDGYSIGIACDGPRGPARIASTVPLVWARASGKRIFVVSYSARRQITLPTWDHLTLPAPFTSGVLMCQEWTQQVPRKASEDQIETLRLDLQAALDEVTDAADIKARGAADRR
ncbi:DUF374 domain-containing protein [Rhodobacteraceae bacterium F11138]|nr:DUF374 domain-containing protein [Rhodobacteraceae bacterium F11138]